MQGIFHPKWTTHFRASVATAGLATVRISRNTGDGGFGENGWQDGTNVTVYEGKARWQEIGQTTKRDFTEDFAQFIRVRVEIAYADIYGWYEANGMTFNGWKPNDKVTMVENASAPDTVGRAVYVWGDMGSSNAWDSVIDTQYNQKQIG